MDSQGVHDADGNLSSQQSLVFAADDAVTFARGVGQALGIKNDDLAAAGANQAIMLQGTQDFRDAGPPHAQHLSQELVSDVELSRTKAILGRQQPAAATLHDGVQSVAGY